MDPNENTQDAQPSPDAVTSTDAVSDAPSATPSNDDPSPSSSDGADDQSSFFDVLNKAAETPSSSDTPPSPEQDPASDDPQAGDAEKDAAADDDDPGDDLPDEITDEERKTMSKRAARRIEKLLSERKAAREQAAQAAPIIDYMKKNDIPMQDVDVVLGLAAQLRKGDFAGFLRTVDPYVKLALQYTGQALPKDLKDQVDQGFVSEQVARELAARRAQASVGRHQAQRTAQAKDAEVRQLRADAIRSAVTQWEETTRKADPDYEVKADIVRRTAQALMAERGAPTSPDQALAYVKEAYSEANKMSERFRPKPKPTQAQPPSVHQTSQTPKREPTSMLDVIQQTVSGS